MGAVTIHLPTDVEEKVREASKEAGVSVSAWLSEAAKKQLGEAPPPERATRWFGKFPELELPTRSEPWSKDEA